ncbi:bifunctional salicylyl-CoA 5-hydroxylase/oxidoreductase [Georgenia sp. Z1491]|uniref:bifunctional salicylyl-CoA 5-hydroxylase/oxidoreductase n=1 Tax=Georgenia sp. Z1491 TaxID=3416707 RepID=UPI003CF4E305
MKIAVIGGGPGGLYFAALMKQLDAAHEVVVYERNRADDTFGFGVVFSDETLGGIENADPTVAAAMTSQFAHWSDIDVHYRGEVVTVGGQGFAAMGRKELLRLLQQRCADLDVDVRFSTTAPDVAELAAANDLVLAADGVNSAVRGRYTSSFGPDVHTGRSKFIWLGTDKVFEAFTFIIRETPWGVMQIHGYPYSADRSTFIVEMDETTWRRAGFDVTEDAVLKPGESDEHAIARIREIFGEDLGGHQVLANNSRWISFPTVRNESWRHENVILLGDAAHTAHFSIGSGTKLAMEDSLALAACLHENADLPTALAAYEEERRPVVESTQRAAEASRGWFESIHRYVGQDPDQFAFNLLTRSRRITQANLELRDPDFAHRIDAAFAERVGATEVVPAMFQPHRIGSLELRNRIVVSAMDMYSAVDGVPQDLHLVHLGSKAMGGAGLVMTEMVCTSADGRITPGCTGLYTDAQRDAWGRVVDYVHAHSRAAIGVQLGHSGRKGSTRLMWEGIDEPLESHNWETVAPSPIPYGPGNAAPREITRAEMDEIREDFVAATRRAAEAGFDLVEVHLAHGYLLSSFLSPVSNRRTDSYGGSLENRLRYPLEVVDAVRSAWPADRPLLARISAVDWLPDGNTDDDAVTIARALIAHGVDGIDVSSGQVAKEERPRFGRSYQTPFADRIRNEVAAPAGATVIAVGAISSYDDVNSILLAGRADLCALGRTHLYDPQWTLHAAAEQEYTGPAVTWPPQFRAGRRRPPTARTDAVRPRLSLLRDQDSDAGTHRRWAPRSPSRA